jgi:hypothetical protein
MFFPHNKSANSTFSHDFSAKRTSLIIPWLDTNCYSYTCATVQKLYSPWTKHAHIHIDVWAWRTGLEDHGIKWKLLPQRQCGTGKQLPSFFLVVYVSLCSSNSCYSCLLSPTTQSNVACFRMTLRQVRVHIIKWISTAQLLVLMQGVFGNSYSIYIQMKNRNH